MWVDKKTIEVFDEMCLLACNEHKQQVSQLEDYNKLVKKKKEIFWMMKIHVMDPFLFNTDYNQTADNWLLDSDIVPDDCVLPFDNKGTGISPEFKDKIVLFDTVSTFTLASLSKVCCICENIEDEDDLIGYYDMKFCTTFANELSKLENLVLEDAQLLINKVPLFNEIRKHFCGSDCEIVSFAFLISYYYFLDISNDPEIALSYFDDIFDEVRQEMKNNDLKEMGNQDYRNEHYGNAIKKYSAGLSMSSYSYYLFGNRAQAFLKLQAFGKAELDCRSAIILRPEWCKGYYRLAQCLSGQKKIHEAHEAADFGIKHSNSTPSSEYNALKEYKENLLKECEKCTNISTSTTSCLETESTKLRAPDLDSCSDVPELTDSSSGNSTEDESDMYDKKKRDSKVCDSCGRKEENMNVVKHPPLKVKKLDVKSKVTLDPEPVESDGGILKRFTNLLSTGSSEIAKKSYTSAKHQFYEALSQVKANPEPFKLGNKNLVILKYAYASACCKSGTLEDLTKAISVFKKIISDHPEIRFPAVFYGLALSYYKMNNFKEALSYLKIVSFDEETKDLEGYNWPGTENLIEESKYEKLKSLVDDLINKCECPPPSDAVCRYERCVLQPMIYLSDPHFKGFVSIHCQERCLLQYHIPCWKAVKEAFDRNDKEFLVSPCITPDCGACIVKVEIVGKDGNIERYFESEELKSKKGAKHKKTKLEKKLELKERKRRRHRSVSLSESHSKATEEVPEPSTEPSSLPSELVKPETENKVSEKEKLDFTECPPSMASILPLNSDLSATAKPFYIIKKDIENKVPDLKPSKHKERKKPKKSTVSIDEFCGNFSGQDLSYYNEYQMRIHRLQETRRVVEENDTWPAFCETERIPELDPNRPFHIPEELRNDPGTLETVLQSYAPVPPSENSKALKEYIYPRFENILQEKGNLYINDPIIDQELQDLPLEWQEIIQESGGFKSFMLQSMRFAIVGETLCFFSEMLNLYNSSKIDELDDFNQVYGSDSLSLISKTDAASTSVYQLDNNISDLNPNAAEYSPSESKSDSSVDRTACFEPANSDNSVSSIPCVMSNGNELVPNFEQNFGDVATQRGLISLDSHDNVKDSFEHISATKEEKNECQIGMETVDRDKSLLTLLTNLRQPLSNYNITKETCQIVNSESTANLSQSDSVMALTTNEKEKMLCPDVFNVEQFVDKLVVLKSQLTNGQPSCALLDNLRDMSTVLAIDENVNKIKEHFTYIADHFTSGKEDKCEQAGTPETVLVSQGVMKEDDELKETLEKLESLSAENEGLINKRKTLEDQLIESLDAVSRLQNKFNVELSVVEKRLVEIEASKKEESKTLKTKISSLEKEVKMWRQKHDLIVETEKESKKENTKLQVKINGYVSKLDEAERKIESNEEKLANQSVIVEKCEKIVQENSLLMDKRIKETAEAIERAKKAETEVIFEKKNKYLQKLDMIIKDGNQKICEIQESLAKSENILQPFISTSLKMLLSRITEHASEIFKIRMKTEGKANELMAKIRSGIPLSELEDFLYPQLPQLPNMQECIPQPPDCFLPPQCSTPASNANICHPPCPPMGHPNYSPYMPVTSQPGTMGNNCVPPVHHPSYFNPFPAANPPLNNPIAKEMQNILSQMSYKYLPNHNPFMSQAPAATPPVVNPVANGQNTTPYFQFRAQPKIPVSSAKSSSAVSASSSSSSSVISTNTAFPPGISTTGLANLSNIAVSKNEGVAATTSSTTNSLKSEAPPKKLQPMVSETTVTTVRSLSPVPCPATGNSSASSEIVENACNDEDKDSVTSYNSVPSTKSNQNKKRPAPVSSSSSQLNLSENFTSTPKKTASVKAVDVKVVPSEPSTLELGYSTATEDVPEAASAAQPTSISLPLVPQVKPEKKGSYNKILDKLRTHYQQIPEAELLNFIRQYREEKTRLTGMTIEAIVRGVSEQIEKALKLRQPQVPVFRGKSVVNKPLVSMPPPDLPKVATSTGAVDNPWGKSIDSDRLNQAWSGDSTDKSCIICLEDMIPFNSMKVECGHRFHHKCIRQWLSKTSNCPVCRVHLLLPEDYPALS